jgi:hypothetical protein
MHRSAAFAMLSIVLSGLPFAASAAPETAPPPAADNKVDLGVTRVALFSSGVGYFECDTTVSGSAAAELSFRTDQINDIIKSMVVQDAGGGKIGVISYASQDPIEKTLRSFGVDLTGKPTLGDLLNQLRGEPVEITGGQNLSGVIVGVEKAPIVDKDGNILQEIERLTVLTSAGLQQLELTKIQGVKLTNEKVDGELRKALATLATAHDADKKSVLVNFEGTGARKVRVAYLLEAPIWKTSYRLVLSEDKKPFIQGWATVENATERDWNNVRLSLVSGRPISFRMDLYTPLYVPRPLEQLELYASLRPPQYEGGQAMMSEQNVALDADGDMSRAKIARKAGRPMPASAAPPPPPAAPRMAGGAPAEEATMGLELRKGVESVATALEAGELFAYNIDSPVSIPRQHSAMLPIVNQEVEAEKVSIYNPATHPKYPLNGLEMKNTTGLNLMQGPVTIFDANIYAGDAKLPDLKPDEKRLVAYALDLSTEVLIKQQPQPDEMISLRIAKGTLWHRHKYVDQREYALKNKADKPRNVVLEQPYTDDWKLIEPKEPYERTQNLLRFKVGVPAKESKTQVVRLERVGEEAVLLTDTGLDQIQFFLRAKVISPAVKQALEKVIALRTERDDAARQRAMLEKQLEEATKEQARIRENLKTLDKETDAYKRQLQNFNDVDTRILKAQGDIAAARAVEEQKRQALDDYLRNLEIQ